LTEPAEYSNISEKRARVGFVIDVMDVMDVIDVIATDNDKERWYVKFYQKKVLDSGFRWVSDGFPMVLS